MNIMMQLDLRPCLGGCGKKFLSQYAGNRICEECRKKNRKIFVKRTSKGAAKSRGILASE